MLDYLRTLPPHLLYAHNGGRFDFHYLLPWASGDVKVINGRIVQMQIGRHVLRDSYAILPIPLSDWSKSPIDYEIFERDQREKHQRYILDYLKSDCESLFGMVSAFVEKFGRALTLAGVAFKQLCEFHEFPLGDEQHDERYRPFYFAGGLSVLAVVSLMVTGMCSMLILCTRTSWGRAITRWANGMPSSLGKIFPASIEMRGLKDIPAACTFCTGLENRAEVFRLEVIEMETLTTHPGLSLPVRMICVRPCSRDCAGSKKLVQFIFRWKHTILSLRPALLFRTIEGEASGDKAGNIFYKLILNSSYGKNGLNPRDFEDWLIVPWADLPDGRPRMREGWKLYARHEGLCEYGIVPPQASVITTWLSVSIQRTSGRAAWVATLGRPRAGVCDADSHVVITLAWGGTIPYSHRPSCRAYSFQPSRMRGRPSGRSAHGTINQSSKSRGLSPFFHRNCEDQLVENVARLVAAGFRLQSFGIIVLDEG